MNSNFTFFIMSRTTRKEKRGVKAIFGRRAFTYAKKKGDRVNGGIRMRKKNIPIEGIFDIPWTRNNSEYVL